MAKAGVGANGMRKMWGLDACAMIAGAEWWDVPREVPVPRSVGDPALIQKRKRYEGERAPSAKARPVDTCEVTTVRHGGHEVVLTTYPAGIAVRTRHIELQTALVERLYHTGRMHPRLREMLVRDTIDKYLEKRKRIDRHARRPVTRKARTRRKTRKVNPPRTRPHPEPRGVWGSPDLLYRGEDGDVPALLWRITELTRSGHIRWRRKPYGRNLFDTILRGWGDEGDTTVTLVHGENGTVVRWNLCPHHGDDRDRSEIQQAADELHATVIKKSTEG